MQIFETGPPFPLEEVQIFEIGPQFPLVEVQIFETGPPFPLEEVQIFETGPLFPLEEVQIFEIGPLFPLEEVQIFEIGPLFPLEEVAIRSSMNVNSLRKVVAVGKWGAGHHLVHTKAPVCRMGTSTAVRTSFIVGPPCHRLGVASSRPIGHLESLVELWPSSNSKIFRDRCKVSCEAVVVVVQLMCVSKIPDTRAWIHDSKPWIPDRIHGRAAWIHVTRARIPGNKRETVGRAWTRVRPTSTYVSWTQDNRYHPPWT